MKLGADLILHPVRMQIVQTLIGGKQLTVQEMMRRLTEVPQATLYRHLNKLLTGGVITVIAQRQIRGAHEKIYALSQTDDFLFEKEQEELPKEQQMSVFMQFAGGLIEHFGQYLNQKKVDLKEDGADFQTFDTYMTDEELREFMESVNAAIHKAASYAPMEGRRKRKISSIIIPEPLKRDENE